MASLKDLLSKGDIQLDEITDYLNELSSEERINQVTALSRSQQIKLWDIAGKSLKELTLEYFVAKDATVDKLFPFEGKNSLPAFTRFQKVFYKAPDGKICGYNNQSLSWFTGPGYYVACPSPGQPGPVAIDYTQLPETKPDSLPPIKSNMAGASRFIYGGTKDFLRFVSPDVVIGRAYKGGTSEMPAWFVLCRGQ